MSWGVCEKVHKGGLPMAACGYQGEGAVGKTELKLVINIQKCMAPLDNMLGTTCGRRDGES